MMRTLILFSVFASFVQASEFKITMKDKKFSQPALTVKVGDLVTFYNQDSFSHGIFSKSETKTFDLGAYPKGQGKPVAFDKPGTVNVECAIHPDMKLVITVKK